MGLDKGHSPRLWAFAFNKIERKRKMKVGYLEMEMVSQLDLDDVLSALQKNNCKFLISVRNVWDEKSMTFYGTVCIYGEFPTSFEDCITDECNLGPFDHLRDEWKKKYIA